jgi:hypothetical protein
MTTPQVDETVEDETQTESEPTLDSLDDSEFLTGVESKFEERVGQLNAASGLTNPEGEYGQRFSQAKAALEILNEAEEPAKVPSEVLDALRAEGFETDAAEIERRIQVSVDELNKANELTRIANLPTEEQETLSAAKAEAEQHAKRVADVEEFLHVDGVKAVSPRTGKVETVLGDDMPENLQAVTNEFHTWQQLPGSERGSYFASLPVIVQDALSVMYGVRGPVDLGEIPSLQEEAK